MKTKKPLILITNDDGVESPGLHALAESLFDLGELLIVAPLEQQSSVGASMSPHSSGRIFEKRKKIGGKEILTYAIEGTPVQAVQHGALELSPRLPDIVVSGINYGENIGASIIVSGTIGATLEAASLGIPALAVSLETSEELYFSYENIDFSAAQYFAHFFTQRVLSQQLPKDVDILKVDVPQQATKDTPWRTTHVSDHKRYILIPPQRKKLSEPGVMKREIVDKVFELNSDIKALMHDKVVSVTPLKLNKTSPVDLKNLQKILEQ